MTADIFKILTDKVIKGCAISYEEARRLLLADESSLPLLLESANRIRCHFRKDKVSLCSIANAKSGSCNQDCKFCAQSAMHNTDTKNHPLIEPQEMLRRAQIAQKTGTERFCLVTSGRSLSDEEIDKICFGLKLIREKFPDLKLDASLGLLTKGIIGRLKQAGLSRYNHNLETSKNYFSNICTTHTFEQRVNTVKLVKAAGLEICCGGILGLGESEIDRLELGITLRELDVDCIPINLLNPIAGTPLESQKILRPEEAFKIIAIFRFLNPKKEIKICGGRQSVLKEKQSQIFFAGADSIILGDYLTTKGNPASQDLEMIQSLGLKV